MAGFSHSEEENGLLAFTETFGSICGYAESRDLTDGVRVTFANGEIIHIRPSGNASELRCYTEVGSAARAQAVLAAALAIMETGR